MKSHVIFFLNMNALLLLGRFSLLM